MKPDLDYVWEKLYLAVRSLAVYDGSLQRRLSAAVEHASTLRETDFPDDESRTRWQAMRSSLEEAMERAPDQSERMLSGVLAMRSDDAQRMAESYLSLYNWVCHARPRREEL